MTVRILNGDCRDVLAALPAGEFQTCVTSPPYFGLRDYGHERQIGREASPEDFVAQMVAVFRGVRRALRHDGTLWLNLGDSYGPDKQVRGIPWRVAFAMQTDGWLCRSAIVWAKPNPMPDPALDRPGSAYEMLFLFAASPQYFFDRDAIREEWADDRKGFSGAKRSKYAASERGDGGMVARSAHEGRHARNVWTIAPTPFDGAHLAPMPPEMAERCIKAGSRPGAAVLDPFGGSGTTGLVADRLKRHATLIELNPVFARLAEDRIRCDSPLFAEFGQ